MKTSHVSRELYWSNNSGWVVILLVVLGAALWWFLSRRQSVPGSLSASGPGSLAQPASGAGSGSMYGITMSDQADIERFNSLALAADLARKEEATRKMLMAG